MFNTDRSYSTDSDRDDADLIEHFLTLDSRLAAIAQADHDEALRDLEAFINHQLACVLADLDSGALSEVA